MKQALVVGVVAVTFGLTVACSQGPASDPLDRCGITIKKSLGHSCQVLVSCDGSEYEYYCSDLPDGGCSCQSGGPATYPYSADACVDVDLQGSVRTASQICGWNL